MKLTQEEKEARKTARAKARAEAKRQAREEAEKNAPRVKSITISVEWVKSKTWGRNPHACAVVEYYDKKVIRDNSFRASGTGYDKEASVIADIFNTYLKYKLYEPRNKKSPYGIGFRYYDEGGNWKNIAEYIGGKFKELYSAPTHSAYEYTDGE